MSRSTRLWGTGKRAVLSRHELGVLRLGRAREEAAVALGATPRVGVRFDAPGFGRSQPPLAAPG